MSNERFAPAKPGNTGIAFLSDDLAGLTARLKDAGVKFPEPYQEGSGGGSAKFSDPDGNVFWLLGVPPPFVRRTLTLRAPREPRPRTGRRTSPRASARARSPGSRAQRRHRG